MPADPLENWFVSDPSRLQGEIYRIQRDVGRVSNLMKKGDLPDGNGFNYVTAVVKRSTPTGGSGWIDVAQEDGSTNNCVPAPSTLNSATTTLGYGLQQKVIFTADICFEDVRRSYAYREQVGAIRENFVAEVVDQWEDRDKAAFFTNSGHKIVFDASRTEGTGATMPATEPTYVINQDLLDSLYSRILRDGGGREAYAQSNGQPLLPLIISYEGSRAIIKGSADVRQDFRFADMGKGEDSTLLKSWGVDKAYGGFMHLIDTKMPRFDFVGGAWVEVPFYISEATTIGNQAIVNPAYDNAGYEDAYIWHPEVVKRLVPKPIGSVGADTRGNAVNFNGMIQWLNIPDKVQNPFQNVGFWAASLKAAYKPAKTQYGYVIRYKRCTQITGDTCAY